MILSAGDRIDVVSPSFAVRPERLEAGVAALQSMGYIVRVGTHALAQDGYLAGSDAARLQDIQSALDAPDSRAVWFSRGGYGMARLLDRLRVERPKLLIGHSDLTVLLHRAARVPGAVALHGPFVSELGEPEAFDAPSLREALSGRAVTLPIAAEGVLAPGRGEGPLVGGNLTVLAHALGTPDAPQTRGAVLLLEDVGEEVYRLDRLLHHLRLAGTFDGVRAVLLGSLEAPPPAGRSPPTATSIACCGSCCCRSASRWCGGSRWVTCPASGPSPCWRGPRWTRRRGGSCSLPRAECGACSCSSPTTGRISRAGSSSPACAPCRACWRRRSRA